MKLGLVIEGGGMKCAYTAGILDRMLDDEIRPDYVIGVSAGAACGASFVAGQRGRNRRFFVDYVTDPDYMGMTAFRRSGDFFNLEYIYQNMTGKDGKDPLDYDAIMKNPAQLWAVATDAETGEAAYFTKKDLSPTDYSVYMASCAIPVACHPVRIGEHLYYDGGCSDSIPVRRALEAGCDKVIILLCRPKDTVRSPEKHRRLYHNLLSRYPALVHNLDTRHERYNAVLKASRRLEEHGHALILAPHEELQITTYTKDPGQLQGLYDTALREYDQDREKLLEFIGA
jgi:predicted patatin/cPLA2 family phospholipase